MAANYDRPKPATPIRHLFGHTLHITCACGRRRDFPFREIINRPGVYIYQTAGDVIRRLRCTSCGERPQHCDVS